MELFNPKNTDLLKSFIETLTKSSRIRLPQNIRQETALTSSQLTSIFGTNEEFLSRYKSFEDVAFSMMKDKKHLAFGQEAVDVESMRKLGRLDLSVFNYEARNTLTSQFNESVLRLDDLLSTAGLPGMEFPSGNLYSSLMKFDVNQTEKDTHAVIAFLNRTFFNVNPNKPGKLAFNFGTSNMLTSEGLQRIMKLQNFQPTGRILTFDVETTGVTKGSQVRSFAARVTDSGREVEEFSAAFENMQMANATIRTKEGSMLLSKGVNIVEGSENVMSMEQGGKEFVEQSKKLFNMMLDPNIQHVSGHNVFFDITQMQATLKGLEATDDEVMSLMGSVFDRIHGKGIYENDAPFLIDTREFLTAYFARKLQEKGIETSEKAKYLLSPELMAKIEMGGSTAPSSVENLVANSNIFELIEDASKSSRKHGRKC